MSRKNDEITKLVYKYQKRHLKEDINLHALSYQILEDMKYIEEHNKRTCEHNFTLIPEFPITYTYGSGGIKYLFREYLFSNEGWDRGYNHDNYYLTITEILEDLLTMTYILSDIFCHKEDEEGGRQSDNINIEFINDFIILNNYFIRTYKEDISKNLGGYISCLHYLRYCKKINNFLLELDKLLKEPKTEGASND